MRLVYIDIDTLRADHLGCYGYQRDTSPNIDTLSAAGWRFDELYVSDSPCLPSRSALLTGRFGVTNGVVNHGGERAEPFAMGATRGPQTELARTSWPRLMRDTGMWCTTISTFAERHSAFHWYAGFNEVYNLGTAGRERADEVSRVAIDWLRRRGRQDDWFLHVHFWDPHTPYRTPSDWGDPFGEFGDAGVPSWIDDDVLARSWELAGPHSAQEVMGFALDQRFDEFPRQPQQIASQDDVRRMFDGYDLGIRYADEHVGRIMDELVDLGIDEDTAIVVSSDHGETLGELGIYCDHQTADLHTHRVPAVLRWPGLDSGRTDTALRYQVDLAATVVELLGGTVPYGWDGRSFASELRGEPDAADPPRSHLVLSCAAWATQRAIRFDRWLCIWTYHDAFHGFPTAMLFDVERDPHEQRNVADEQPDVVGRAARLLLEWETVSMERSPSGVDPLWTVIKEGGGYYTRGRARELSPPTRRDRPRRLRRAHPGRTWALSRCRATWRTVPADAGPLIEPAEKQPRPGRVVDLHIDRCTHEPGRGAPRPGLERGKFLARRCRSNRRWVDRLEDSDPDNHDARRGDGDGRPSPSGTGAAHRRSGLRRRPATGGARRGSSNEPFSWPAAPPVDDHAAAATPWGRGPRVRRLPRRLPGHARKQRRRHGGAGVG